MKTFKYFITLILTSFSIYSYAQSDKTAVGNWTGELDLPTGKLELIFKIAVDETGTLVTKMDVPAQGARDLGVKETQVSSDSLLLDVAVILGKFEGKFTAESTVDGKWVQSGMSFPLKLNKTASVTELKRPQTPVGPFPYEIREVEYVNQESGFKIAGTLTLPQNAKNCPAVLLISGSGAQDRDETVYDHKPFLVIADYLTKKGVAVLRVDDRGIGGSEGNIAEVTSEDFATDVETGINFLKTINEINSDQIGLIGHSEGGLVAPIVATQSKNIAFIVLLAVPGITGEQIIYAQVEMLNKAYGLNDEQVTQKLKVQKAVFDILLNQKDTSDNTEQLRKIISNGMFSTLNATQKNAIDAQIKALKAPSYQFFLRYNPYQTLVKLNCPVLALNGSKDLQVSVEENLTAIESALKEGGNKNFKTMKLDGLNHLFQHCETGATSEYASIEETFSPEVLDIINDWIWNSALKN